MNMKMFKSIDVHQESSKVAKGYNHEQRKTEPSDRPWLPGAYKQPKTGDGRQR